MLLKWGESVKEKPENLDKLSLSIVSDTTKLLAPFYFNQEYGWYTDITSGLMNMLVGVDGVHETLKNKTGLVFEKEEGDVSWIYHPPVDAFQYMYSILPHELDAAGQKYQDLDMIRESLNSTFWMNMATCHQIRMHVSCHCKCFVQ